MGKEVYISITKKIDCARQSNLALTLAIGLHISAAVKMLVAIAARLILVYAATIIVTKIGMMDVTETASGGHGIERVVSGVSH